VTYQLSVTAPASGAGTVTSAPAGINCPGTCTYGFGQNTQVTLTATPAANYAFTGWTGACTGTSTCNVTLTAAASVTAAFTAAYSLTVSLSGTGTGTITSTPAGINCTTGTCSASFTQGTQVSLSEIAGSGDIFTGWSGACTGTGTCSVTLSAASSVTAGFNLAGTIQSLNHIIVFAQENRSFDHYFGYMRQYWANNGIADQQFDGLPQFTPAADCTTAGQCNPPALIGCDPSNPNGTDECTPDSSVTVTSYHFQSVCQEEMSPFWNEGHRDWDLNDPTGVGETQGLNNGFVVTAADDARQYYLPVNDTNGLRAMGYFDGKDLNYYYFMASNFATSDRWFAPVIDRTQINRMYLLAATSVGNVYPLGSGSAPSGQLSNTTIFEALQNAGITWKIYVDPSNTVNTQGQSCSSLTGTEQSACLVENSYINEFTYEDAILNSPTLLQNIAPISQLAIDAQSDTTMPQVALIEPASPAGYDEHPSDSDDYPVNVQDGANYASQQINTLMTSAVWYDSAMIFTYDESGGFYDHVSPQPVPAPDSILPKGLEPGDICDASGDIPNGTCNFQWTGYRVPMIVISPFARKNFVSHVVRDYTAILNFIEERFGVPALTARDAYWSSSAAGTNPPATMDEFFDFVNIPWATPPTPPTQTIYPSSACNLGVPVTTGSP